MLTQEMNPLKRGVAKLIAMLSLFLVANGVFAQDEWKLIWYDHFQPNQPFEVVRTDVSLADVENRLFHTWCVPFDQNHYDVLEQILVAAGEHWRVDGRNQFLAERGLPPLNERWFQIMDDERWFAFRVRPR